MEFLTVALVHLLAVASPGPDFAVVVRESVTRGQQSGSWTAIGVGGGILLHVSYSLLGIGLIVSQSIVLFNLFKWLAAAYLVYSEYRRCVQDRSWRPMLPRPASGDSIRAGARSRWVSSLTD